MEYQAINIAEKIENQGLYFDIKPGYMIFRYSIWIY